MKNREQAKKEIFDKVTEYYQNFHQGEPFVAEQSKINYAGRVYDEKEMINLVDSALDFWLTAGKYAKEFEKRFAEFIGIKHCLLTNSGSSANLLAMSSLTSPLLGNKRCKKGDEVITVATAFPTTVNPIVQNGLVPVFVDIDLDTLNIDVDSVEDAITDKTKAIFVAHTLGNPFDLDVIDNLKEKYNLDVIEDTCDALGSKYRDYMVGSFGDLSTYSFFPPHHMSCSKDTPIPYLDNEGKWRIESIQKLFLKYSTQPNTIKVISFDNQHKVKWSIPSAILKHRKDRKRMIKITTQHGRNVIVTEDHSVFILDRNTAKIISCFSKEIKPDDYIVVTNKIPIIDNIKYIDTIEYFRDKNAYVSGFSQDNLKSVHWEDRWQFKSRDSLPIKYLSKYNLSKEKLTVGILQSKTKIPARIIINKELCRLIGYFLAEGSYSNGLIFSFNTDEIILITDVQNILKSLFNLSSYISKVGEHGIIIKTDSKNIEYVFKDIFGVKKGAHNKRIPWFLYHTNEDCIKSFIYGYTKGDGSIRIMPDNHNNIDVTSVSKALLNDFQYLLSMVGISACFYRSSRSKGNYSLSFSGYIYDDNSRTIIKTNSKDRQNYHEQIPLLSKFREYICVSKKQKTTSKNRLKKYINSSHDLYSLINGDLSFLKVRKIQKINNDDEYVYDISVPENENFYGGCLGLFLHNTTGEGGAVCTNNNLLNKIVMSLRDWGRDCHCNTGQDNACGKRFKGQFGSLPQGYDHKYVYSHIGYNLKATDMQASVGVAQLDKLPSFIESRKNNHKLLLEGLKQYGDFFTFQTPTLNSDPSWFGFSMIVKDSTRFTRNEIVQYLESKKIATRMLFSGNIIRHPCFKDVNYRVHSMLRNTDTIMNNQFWIGVYPGLTKEMIDYIIKIFGEFIDSH